MCLKGEEKLTENFDTDRVFIIRKNVKEFLNSDKL